MRIPEWLGPLLRPRGEGSEEGVVRFFLRPNHSMYLPKRISVFKVVDDLEAWALALTEQAYEQGLKDGRQER